MLVTAPEDNLSRELLYARMHEADSYVAGIQGKEKSVELDS